MADPIAALVDAFQEFWREACRQRLERLAESLEPWMRAMLTEPLPEDWQAEVDRFVENTLGRRVSPCNMIPTSTLALYSDRRFSWLENSGKYAQCNPVCGTLSRGSFGGSNGPR